MTNILFKFSILLYILNLVFLSYVTITINTLPHEVVVTKIKVIQPITACISYQTSNINESVILCGKVVDISHLPTTTSYQ